VATIAVVAAALIVAVAVVIAAAVAAVVMAKSEIPAWGHATLLGGMNQPIGLSLIFTEILAPLGADSDDATNT
jgi:hypothetical protein